MTTLHQELKEFIIQTMNMEDITTDQISDETPLFAENGLGLDSIDALELVLALKKKYGVVLEANEEQARAHLATISTLAILINQHRG